ncbi:MAG: hypothetical protein NE328_08590 [Lentisphaeraceae bacterium]|nr:hypothetical protein [Lentisphaeraceae bacterium]
MKKSKTTDSIVCGGGWKEGSNTAFKTIVLSYGFYFFLRIETIIILSSIIMYLILKINPENILPLVFLTTAAISQPYILYMLVKTYGTKTVTKKVECLNLGEPTPLEKVDPHNLY